MKKLFFIILYLLPLFGLAQIVIPKKGLKITNGCSFKQGEYKLIGDTTPVIIIEGDNIKLDFANVVFNGKGNRLPDQFSGICILVRNSKNVIIKNLVVQGYKVALLAENTDSLVLDNCNLSYNYRKQLNSTQEKEDISDWMSYHHNDKDEWLRYGAAIYLKNCMYATVKNCKVTGGQNALMMMACNNANVYNNDFSFNSGIGVGLYKSSFNRFYNNRIIFNVRGYSHGVYNRGQDSAGFLVYEQSSNNIFYQNNVTHGGDGFFLWAGQKTMDTGAGGCNDNLLYRNDFSYAPTNGVEATFSRNRIINNIIRECDHGIWGGYSYATQIYGNTFADNRIGIAIEHGQNNQVTANTFLNDKTGVKLWSNKTQPSDWGYAKYRDTRSVAWDIKYNSFEDVAVPIHIVRTDSIKIEHNRFLGNVMQQYKMDSTATNATIKKDSFKILPPEIITGLGNINNKELTLNPFSDTARFAGRKNIMITKWGPYDFRYPLIWNTNPVDTASLMKFDIIGPKGNWRLVSVKGLKNISALRGKFPTAISAEKLSSTVTDIEMVMEYTGEKVVTVFGEKVKAGKPLLFRFTKFFQPIDWTVQFYAMDTALYNPVKTGALFQHNKVPLPFKSEKVNKIDYAWWGGIKADKQYGQFITVAEGDGNFYPGKYEFSFTWDDAVRLYVDGKIVFDEWDTSKYSFDESPNKKIILHLKGKHHLMLEHLEMGGFATLSLKMVKL